MKIQFPFFNVVFIWVFNDKNNSKLNNSCTIDLKITKPPWCKYYQIFKFELIWLWFNGVFVRYIFDLYCLGLWQRKHMKYLELFWKWTKPWAKNCWFLSSSKLMKITHFKDFLKFFNSKNRSTLLRIMFKTIILYFLNIIREPQ
jgi:hypothetical protein